MHGPLNVNFKTALSFMFCSVYVDGDKVYMPKLCVLH